jgi:hypothetical protein
LTPSSFSQAPSTSMRADADITTDFIEEACVGYNNRLGDPIDSEFIVVMVPSFIALTTKHGSETFPCISGFLLCFLI